MNQRQFSGWRGVTDHLHILIAVSYEPIEGTLSCRFCSGDPVIHINVPEAKYQTLIHSPYAGSYYRKHIKPKFPYMPGTEPKAEKILVEDKKAIERKKALLDAKRAKEAPVEVQVDLFNTKWERRQP